jgi:hypothetical protein
MQVRYPSEILKRHAINTMHRHTASGTTRVIILVRSFRDFVQRLGCEPRFRFWILDRRMDTNTHYSGSHTCITCILRVYYHMVKKLKWSCGFRILVCKKSVHLVLTPISVSIPTKLQAGCDHLFAFPKWISSTRTLAECHLGVMWTKVHAATIR